jgi:extradiol dioxygenase family protein
MVLYSWFHLFFGVLLLAEARGLYCGNKNCYEVLEVSEYILFDIERPLNKTLRRHTEN